MRLPARNIVGQLVWTTSGATWAVWRVRPKTYPYLPMGEKQGFHARLRKAIVALGAEAMLLSVCERVDPADVVERMVAGLDLEDHPAWVEVASRTLEDLGGEALYRRAHFMAALLPHASTGGALRAALGSARGQVGDSFGLAPPPVSAKEVAERQRQADTITTKLRGSLRVRPATVAELRWLYARAPRRGVSEPTLDPTWSPRESRRARDRDGSVRGPSLASLGDAVFYEGGERTDADRPRGHRRYLRVETEAGLSYQSVAVVSDMPHSFVFPGGGAEWFARADEFGFPVDWCARVKAIPNAEAQVKAKKQDRQLRGQFDEWDGELAGAPPSLAQAVEGITHERGRLAANPGEPEFECTLMFALWADNLPDLEDRSEQLRDAFQADEYGLPRPTGGQLALYGAMLPGAPLPPVAKVYSQWLMPSDLAAGAPFAGTEVGDPQGMLLAYSLDAGMLQPVLFDPTYGPQIDRSPSLYASGALGSGKSYFLKEVAWSTLARGGQVIALDRTPKGEYVRFAKVVPGVVRIVRLTADAGAEVCLDPLRVFRDPKERVRYALGFLSLLTATNPTDLEGAALGEAVRKVAERPGGRLPDVVAALEQEARTDPSADVVYRKLRHASQGELAGLAFGDGPTLDLDADLIVFHTPGLALPDRAAVESAHLARQMLPEQVFSQALLYLVAATARSLAFSDDSRFTGVAMDETWALTSNPQGQQLLFETIRDSRKHNAACWLASQHPSDLGDPRLLALIGNHFVFQQSRESVRDALEHLGIEANESLVSELERSDEGDEDGLVDEERIVPCLWRDVRNRLGLVRILKAPLAELHDAFRTTPPPRKRKARATTSTGTELVAVAVDEAATGSEPDADPDLEELLKEARAQADAGPVSVGGERWAWD